MAWKRVSLWAPPIVYMIAIFHFSSQSEPMPAVTKVVWDKLLHTTEYAGLAALLCRGFLGERLGWLASLTLAVVVTSVYGASDEWHQSFVPLRDADVLDWLADTLGAATGAAVYAIGLRWRAPRRRPRRPMEQNHR